jgi:subtilisin
MNIRKIRYFLPILILLGVVLTASAATTDLNDSRYLVKTNSQLWKKSFSARHAFSNGFTADLTDWQLRLTKIFKIEVEKVKKLTVLTLGEEISASRKPVEARTTPTDQLTWGVKMVYNDDLLEKPTGGKDIKIAVIDTGVLKTHSDLKGRIIDCKDFTQLKLPIVEGKCDDKNGHGTHVAGIIAADGGEDGLGIYGVAPDAEIMAYKVCGTNGSCWADDVAAGIRTAADEGANIANLSLGSDVPSGLIADAVNYAVSMGMMVVAAAGNDGDYQGSIDYPAAMPEVIGVGALDSQLAVADWSSRGNNTLTEKGVMEEGDLDFAAPGVNIESTWKDGSYVILSGTSMAAPHVAGLAALLWQKDSETPAESTREVLRNFVLDIYPVGEDDDSGFGMPRLKD